MNRKLAVVTLMTLTVVSAFLVYQLLFRGPRFSGPDSRPELATGAAPDSGLQLSTQSTTWSRFRGPNGQGAADPAGVPLQWSSESNLQWRTSLPGPGSSSPVLTKDRVFLTCYSGYGVDPQAPGNIDDLKRHLVCVQRSNGEILWSKTIPAVQPEQPWRGNGLPEHGYATNTPVTDGQNVYAFFGKSGVFAYDRDGNALWERSVGDGLGERGWGTCASLILFNDLVIVNAAEESNALVALRKDTGEVAWRATSPRLSSAFTTPVLVPIDDQRTDLVMPVIEEIWGINPVDGKLRWFCQSPIGGNVSPITIVDGQKVYCCGGYQKEGSICVQAGGTGDVSETNVLWTSDETSYISSPVLYKDLLFWLGNDRFFYCQDTADGQLVEKSRIPSSWGTGRMGYASSVLVGDKILVTTRHKGIVVVEAQPELEVVYQNQFADDDSQFNATPAIDSGQIYIRSNRYLYCVGQPTEETAVVAP